MSGDQAFEGAAPVLLGRHAAAREHRFQGLEQLFSNDEVLRVAGVVKRDEDLVGQASSMPRGGATAFAGFTDIQICLCELTHISTATHLGEDSRPPIGS